jgi:hypothetical protein
VASLSLGLFAAAGAARAQQPEGAAQAEAPASPSPSASPGETRDADSRYQLLFDRQRQLEELLQRQDAQLRTLQQTVALPPAASGAATPPPPDHSLAVNPKSAGPTDPELSAPLAGYSDRNFFLRDRHSWFVLVPKGRINVDWYNFLNRPPPPNGVIPNSDNDPRQTLRDTIFIRRARVGLSGTIARHIDFRVEAEFASLPTPGQYATLTDASIVVNYSPYIQLEVGQFYTPFTLENPTSENYTDFMEKAATVRFVVPTSRDIGAMLQGTLPRKFARYWVGVFNGDGQNFKNLDNQPAIIGRAYIAPFTLLPRHAPWLDDIWLGGSFWWQRADNLGGVGPASTTGATSGDVASLTTQGGFTVFSSNYRNGKDAMNNAIRSHLAADGTVLKYAIELNVPITRYLGLRSEFVHQSMDLRQYNDFNPGTGDLKRNPGLTGFLDGYAGYVEAYAWIGGPVNVDKPGLYQTPHWNGYVPPPLPHWAVMVGAKYEHVEMSISGLPNTSKATSDPANGHYALDVFELGGNLWVTRHSRFIVNYVLNYIDSGDPREAAVLSKSNLFFQAYEHELLFRFAVSL